MHKIKIDGKLYDFPNKLSEVTIEKFQRIVNIKSNLTTSDDIDKAIDIVSILMDVDKELIGTIPYSDFAKLVDLSKFIFTSTSDTPKFEVTIDKVKYGMINDISKMSTGEFVDLDTLLSDKDNVMDNLHIILAILYRPINKKGIIEKYSDTTLYQRAEIFKKNLTCDYAISAMLFSLALVQVSTEHMQDSLIAEEKELNNPMNESK